MIFLQHCIEVKLTAQFPRNWSLSVLMVLSLLVITFMLPNFVSATAKISALTNDYDEDEKPHHRNEMEILPPPPPLPRYFADKIEKQVPVIARAEEEDIFVSEGVNYAVTTNDIGQSPASEDMEESPRARDKPSYFNELVYGPVAPPPKPPQNWQQMNGYDVVQAHALAAGGYQGSGSITSTLNKWLILNSTSSKIRKLMMHKGTPSILQDSRFLTQEEKDRGLGSVFKRDDQRHLQEMLHGAKKAGVTHILKPGELGHFSHGVGDFVLS